MTTFFFPGQGVQTAGFLHALPDVDGVSETLQEAAEALKADPLSLDSEESLKSTVNVQLGLLIAGTACARALIYRGVLPDGVAGISIGSFGAAVAADAIDFADALALVKMRATLMECSYPTGYGMAAFGGLRQARLEQLVKLAEGANEPLYLANFNAAAEIVVTGASSALERLITLAKDEGARRAQRLDVSVPSHCPLLAPVSTALSKAITQYDIRAPKINYVGNRTARLLRDANAVTDELAGNVSHPVLWHDSTTLLYELGERLFIEMPPGNTLTNLVRDAFDDLDVKSMNDTPIDTIVYMSGKQKNA
ncbi:malonate decarboxylase subunit epsilon [Rhizobium panacihumi]|uniref:malonate decarboxylase subunit epsilon n=1 Tax=Rhizobium panacihumi TaxID=2008450 RepID=UPI003D7B6A54